MGGTLADKTSYLQHNQSHFALDALKGRIFSPFIKINKWFSDIILPHFIFIQKNLLKGSSLTPIVTMEWDTGVDICLGFLQGESILGLVFVLFVSFMGHVKEVRLPTDIFNL